GHKAVLRAYEILAAHTSMPTAVLLPADSDPAQILQTRGADALNDALQRTEPLAAVVIDAYIDSWGQQLDFTTGQLNAMRGAPAPPGDRTRYPPDHQRPPPCHARQRPQPDR